MAAPGRRHGNVRTHGVPLIPRCLAGGFGPCYRLTPGGSSAPQSHSLPPAGWGRESHSLIGRAKAAQACKAKSGIRSLLPMGRQVSSHFQESGAASCVTVTWEDKRRNSKRPPFLPLSPSSSCQAPHHMVRNRPLGSWGQLSWLSCPLPASCVPPACSLAGRRQKW